jgi:integral membrane protein (TIGR01906 family)
MVGKVIETKKRFVALAAYVNAVCLCLITLYGAVIAPTFNTAFYEWQFRRNGTADTVNVLPEDLTAVTQHLLDYMRGRVDSLQIPAYINGVRQDFFSDRAIEHMVDVKNLFFAGRATMIGAVALFVVSLVVAVSRKGLKETFTAYRNTAIAMGGGLCVVTVLTALNFERAFEIFHRIFFFNDLWMLDMNDTLLNIVPQEFFVWISGTVAGLFVGFLALMGIGGEVARRFCKDS